MSNYTMNNGTRVIDAAQQQTAQVMRNVTTLTAQAALDSARQIVRASTDVTGWATEILVDGNRQAIRAATDTTSQVTQAAGNNARQLLSKWSTNAKPNFRGVFELQSSAIATWQTFAEEAIRNNGTVLEKVQTTIIRQAGTAVQNLQRSSLRVVESAVRRGQNVVVESNKRGTNDR